MHSVLDTLAEGGLLIIDAASSFTDSLSLTLSGEDAAALADKNAQPQLNTSIGSLTLDSASFAGLSRTANGGTVVLSIQKLLRSSLNNALQAELDEHAAVYSVTAVCGGRTVTNLNGLAQLKLPYTLQRDERADYIRTSMLGSDTLIRLTASYADGFVTFATSTLARFAVDVPDKLYSVTIALAPVVRNGTASASVGVDEATKALEKLYEGGELILDARTLQAVTASEVSVPRTIVQSLIAKNQSLRVCANGSEILLDSTALRSAAANLTGASLRVCTAQLANADLPIAARSIFETADLWRVWLSDGTRELTTLANGSVSVTLSYTLAWNQNASDMALYAVDANGGYTWLRAVNDKTAHPLTCTGYSLGTFALTDRLDGVLPFTDVAPSDWYYDDVRYVYQNGLMNGVTATQFAPKTNITRGMLVTILWRVEGEPAAAAASLAGFSDASSVLAYALDAVRWAVGVSLMNGKNGQIDPAGFTTRAESAALLHRYFAQENYA